LSIKASPWLNYAQRRHRSIANILQHAEAGEDITVTAWVKVVRQQKHVVFVNIADGSTVKDIQAVLNPADGAKYV
jgi:aspartyl/asparaginyl-tRNA synthetase